MNASFSTTTFQNNSNYENVTRVILLGITGSVQKDLSHQKSAFYQIYERKSSLGNTLLNYQYFEATASQIAVTEHCRVGYRLFNNRHLVVVDTPGFFDNRDDDEKETCRKIGQSLQITVPGPHAFLIVLPLSGGGRVTDEVRRGYTWIEQIFGEHAFNYCIVVFTGMDNLEADGKTLEQYLSKQEVSFAALFKKCGNRYIAFNNRASVENKTIKTQELINLIDTVGNNGNQVFRNKEIKEISKVVEEERKNDTYEPNLPDGRIILLPQTEKIVVEAYMRKPCIRRNTNN